MRRTSILGRVSFVIALTGLALACGRPERPAQEEAAGPSIEGTYELVSRELPDGTTMEPPAIFGLLTYTGQHRNFHVYWEDPGGERFSIAYVATYSLTDSAYEETSLYYMQNDEIGGEGLRYDFSNPSGSSAVTMSEGQIEFDLPLYGEPHVVFDGDGMTATREGEFVDHWEKVR